MQLLQIPPHARDQAKRCIVVGLRSHEHPGGKRLGNSSCAPTEMTCSCSRSPHVLGSKPDSALWSRSIASKYASEFQLCSTGDYQLDRGRHTETGPRGVLSRNTDFSSHRTSHSASLAECHEEQKCGFSKKFGALSAGMRTNGSVPVSALHRRSNKRRLAMPDQLRGSINASLLKARRKMCSLLSLPISSGSCPLRAFLCAAAAGLKFLLCCCMQGCIGRAVVSQSLVNPLRSGMCGGLLHCAHCTLPDELCSHV
jgi:hypothetical protein